MKTGASFARGQSKQDYATPKEFIAAVENKFGKLVFDLAATKDNSVCGLNYFGADSTFGIDSFEQDWTKLKGLLWLNPPFDNIAPWAEKCRETYLAGKYSRTILLLTPASIGSNWFKDCVWQRARVFALNGRLCFDGKAPYPKDCMLSVFGLPPGFEVWKWK